MSIASAEKSADVRAVRPVAPARRARLSQTRREWVAAYLFLLPDVLGLLLFIGIPMVLALSLGFFDVSGFGTYTFAGLDNYRRMLADPLFLGSLQVTAKYVVVLVPGLYVSGLGLALLVKRPVPLLGSFRAMLFLPNVVSLVPTRSTRSRSVSPERVSANARRKNAVACVVSSRSARSDAWIRRGTSRAWSSATSAPADRASSIACS